MKKHVCEHLLNMIGYYWLAHVDWLPACSLLIVDYGSANILGDKCESHRYVQTFIIVHWIYIYIYVIYNVYDIHVYYIQYRYKYINIYLYIICIYTYIHKCLFVAPWGGGFSAAPGPLRSRELVEETIRLNCARELAWHHWALHHYALLHLKREWIFSASHW